MPTPKKNDPVIVTKPYKVSGKETAAKKPMVKKANPAPAEKPAKK